MLALKCTSTAAKNSVLSFGSSLLPWAPIAGVAGWIPGGVACTGEDLSFHWLMQHHLHIPRGWAQGPFLGNPWKLTHRGLRERRVVVRARAGKNTLLSETSAYWQVVSLCAHTWVILEGNQLASCFCSSFSAFNFHFLGILDFSQRINLAIPFRLEEKL